MKIRKDSIEKKKNPFNPLEETVKYVLFDVAHKEPDYKRAIKKKKKLIEEVKPSKSRNVSSYLKKLGTNCIDTCPFAKPIQIYLFPPRQLLALKGLLKDLTDLIERAEAVERRRAIAKKRQFAKLKAAKELADGLAMTQRDCYVPIHDNIPDTTQLAYG